MDAGWPVCPASSTPAIRPSGPGFCDGDGLPVRGVGTSSSTPGEGKILPVAGAGATLSLAAGGAFLATADCAESLAAGGGGGTSSGGETFLLAAGDERLAVTVRG